MAAGRKNVLAERRLGFVYGFAAGALLWTGIDGSLPDAFERLVRLPAGALGDALALVLVLAWGVVTLAFAWPGVTGRPLWRRGTAKSLGGRRAGRRQGGGRAVVRNSADRRS